MVLTGCLHTVGIGFISDKLKPFFTFVNIEDFLWALNLVNPSSDVGH